ncbi:hypothetical protein [Paenibacillus tarimensis]|uniref:hypothetical protein n=1 Tax=Paenibacillus tarimensis TaxID=416012 RepID=UPI001F2E9058|nr:hypothetical protein [Paenibacillus tarimensis]MCF2946369.1 hypothetical protein [Paenibacillus tarimensis]
MIRQADEVGVFELFGGDLPAIHSSRKLKRKTSGRPGGQRIGGMTAGKSRYGIVI